MPSAEGNSPQRSLIQTTISSALLDGESRLADAGFVLRPRRHAELLLEAALGVDRTTLYLRARDIIPPDAGESYEALLARRLGGEPVQHVVGWAPFYGRQFAVGRGVFIPRFDSELLVPIAIEHAAAIHPARLARGGNGAPVEMLDLCCGCGAIGLSAAAELPFVRITLADNDRIALRFSAANTQALGLASHASVVCWDALGEPPDEWRGRFDIIAANPPYIPEAEIARLHPDVRDGEPPAALTDGGDGLIFYRRWSETAPMMLKRGGLFIAEVGDGAAGKVQSLLKGSFESVTVRNDLSGNPRAVVGRF